ncbi:DUF927 domain-containing protein [Staphylococcus pseudintermedius]|uniref:DUF927 domain-containing protein n=2 Tax=Staphylococcus TaxID=1279 RepID=A0ABS0QPQ2_9STAP|nr:MULTISPECIES: DUF927 domain-containing protein [Staphylococcus]EGQ3102786.1 DUF927 domain-containing protein [Staphylococcus pseudintermedius]MBH9581243.1 DUF927 domain-containing protein [Staphylococcus felis]MBH9623132.1 DUF927 domain-containing protein [Staphylococcus pseudintermedius]MBI0389746.1 DUF927 domain-containing protein [Staphylococcus pseudintermedius]MCE5416314.1 DUF927 domain-containing protein [Staphylococcus pseudintermedius]
MAELPNDVIEVINKETLADIIPTNYKVGDNGWLYKEVEKGKGDNAKVVPVLITSTTPYITKKYKDIETGEFTYQLKFNSAEKENKHTVLARDLADATHIINLADRGFDVNTINRVDLVNYISMYMRLNPLPITRIVTRLGHVDRYFIHPLIKDVELAIYEQGYKNIAKEFKTKGTLQDYAQNVFTIVSNSYPAMMLLYASCGSILLHDFDVEPFIIDLSGASSRGKTTALKVASSVWGTSNLIGEWNTTRVNIERKSAFLNSFPLLLDDSRKANPYMLPDVIYQFSGGREKGRGNKSSIEVERTWQNIMISTGETSLADNGKEKAGIGARIITLQDDPFNSDVSFIDLYKGINSQYGTLGIAFMKQYHADKEAYYRSFKSHEKRFIDKAENNEIMARIGRNFALLQVAGEIINDIEGFEHDPYVTIDQAYNSMLETNKNIDKPKQLLEELLQYLDANRNNIEGDGYDDVTQGDIKAIYKRDFLLIMGETLKQYLGHELNSITKQWNERGYLITDKETLTKRVGHKSKKPRGYAIKKTIIEGLGYDFSQWHSEFNGI